jgi:hypothetical protein
MFNAVLSVFGAIAVTIGLSVAIRSRGPKYHYIDPSEIHPDLAANEDLLNDALREYERMQSHLVPVPPSAASRSGRVA